MFTLNAWASTGRIKLPFYKVGRRTMYKESDLLAFLEGACPNFCVNGVSNHI
ncbi:helix-turn-helix domain-containing protein [Vogesella fluminis]|uniref:helix-turn-helix domain-containing protein n=1 Tax=Vogesella fluminis TaxID=1069161 RepID=UPI0036288179